VKGVKGAMGQKKEPFQNDWKDQRPWPGRLRECVECGMRAHREA